MGGRLVTELAASEPDRAIAVILLDAIVGDTWDRMVNVFRVFPPLLVGTGVTLWLDTVDHGARGSATRRRPLKLGRLVAPDDRRPRAPAVAAARPRGVDPAQPGLQPMLDRLREERIPVFVIHGDRDLAVPIATAKDAARRTRGDLVVVQRRQPLVAAQGPRDDARRSCTPSCGAGSARRC